MTDQSEPREARILIVDDSPMSVRPLSHYVRDMGSIRFALSGVEALELAAEYLPDIILMDVEMPTLDGLEVCQELKQRETLKDIPVIFVTARVGVEHEVACLAAGGVDFITKPPNESVVRARVKAHLTLKRQADLLRELASIDGLTGIHNRRAFDERITVECRRHRRTPAPIGIAMIDVDHFKIFNDVYGHVAGDDCLRQIAQAIDATARRPGELAARYGGEEFVVLLPNTDVEAVVRYAENLLARVRELKIPHVGNEGGIVTVSIGVTSGEPVADGCNVALVTLADDALYQAKLSGRNRVCLQKFGE
jgi:diguanylate cyclase (GGDEF)-like protein